jgi:hypothetical protein
MFMGFIELHVIIFMSYSTACMGKMRNAYKILVGKPEGKEPFGRLKNSWG